MKSYLAGQKGFGVLETALALGILSIVSLAFFSGLAGGARAEMITREQTTAENLARGQMEYVKQCTYVTGANEYPVDPSIVTADGWEILPAAVTPLHTPDDGLQKITVTVRKNGNTIFQMAGYKSP